MSPELTELVESLVVLASGIAALGSLVGCFYVVWVYNQRHGDAPFLTRLVVRDVRVGICSAVILGYLALALSDHGLGRPWGAVVIGVPVILMMWGPISDALIWRRERRLARLERDRDKPNGGAQS